MSTETTSESADSAGPDRADLCAHLDEDAECLEDPVHCGDARHQHDAHKAVAEAGGAAATSEPAQA